MARACAKVRRSTAAIHRRLAHALRRCLAGAELIGGRTVVVTNTPPTVVAFTVNGVNDASARSLRLPSLVSTMSM